MKLRAVLSSVLAALVVLSSAACGGGDSGAGRETGTDGVRKVTFAGIPAGQLGTVVLGKEKGIFSKHGFDLQISWVEPPAIVPGLMGGQADFAWITAPGLLTARGNNVPIKSVTTVSTAGEEPAAFPTQLLVPKGSPIKAPKDLVGKKVATASLFQVPDLALMSWLIEAGIDPSDVDFVEVPFPNMAEALTNGRVDAVLSSEPFVSIGKSTIGAERLMSISEGLPPTSPISVVATSEKFIAGNADLVDDVRAAVDETMAYAKAHPDEVRKTMPTFTELKPELADVILLAPIDTKDDPAAWDAWADLLVKVGAVKEKPNPADAFIAD